MVNGVDSDQTVPEEQSDLGLHCLFLCICPYTAIFMEQLKQETLYVPHYHTSLEDSVWLHHKWVGHLFQQSQRIYDASYGDDLL